MSQSQNTNVVTSSSPSSGSSLFTNSTWNIDDYKLSTGPPTIYYIPEFVTPTEEKDIIEAVNRVPKPRWAQLSNRRLQNWGGVSANIRLVVEIGFGPSGRSENDKVPHPKGMIAEEIPNWLKVYTEKIGHLGLFDGKMPNHVLVNEYSPGQGIMPHLDGPLFYPTISTINLASHTVLNFYQPMVESENKDDFSEICLNWNERLAHSLLLQPRSLLILKDETYEHFLHGIEEITEDVVISDRIVNLDRCTDVIHGQKLERATRVSLTIRHVPKTTKLMIKLGR